MLQSELRALFERTKKELSAIGYTPGPIWELRVSGRLRRAWANCAYDRRHGTFTITIGRNTLEKGCKESIRGTLFHELLHTCKGCFNHGYPFRKGAEAIRKAYGIRVSRTTSEEVMYGIK